MPTSSTLPDRCPNTGSKAILKNRLPKQIATVEVPEEHMGSVVELLGKRRGQMFDMQGLGYVHHSSY
ncbi:hypothetical protein CTI12_AA599230 [Artemisia annua]|uniref:Elongation factor EFG domain-containing protein n=1 Tax=Artemisia annua TaxID=35608 RepID=A0A2U1KIL2_ARTAN|nr:hypothetical protein CTI12_AA599230 [Artemisia annua]